MNDALKRHFEAARTFVEVHAPAWVQWCRNRPSVILTTQRMFMMEYAFVVSASGFRASVVERRFHALAHALKEFEMPGIASMNQNTIRSIYMETMLKNPEKAEAFARGLLILTNPVTVEDLKAKLAEGNLNALKVLPWIGDVTKYHLARNLGVDVAKPDLHLLRLAKRFGYGDDVTRMCRDLAAEFGERVAAVDGILWEYARSVRG